MKIKGLTLMKAQDGFSLVEVLIAIAVFSVGMLSIAALQTSAIKGNGKANNLTERTTWAASQVENLLNLPFTDPLLTAGLHNHDGDTIDNDNDGDVDEGDEDGVLQGSVFWNVVDDSPTKKTITMTIARDSFGEATVMTMTTVKLRIQ